MTIAENNCVLIVEDDEGVAILQQRALERRGFQVQCVTNAQDAIAAAMSREYQLIVTDYRLERSSGLELLGKLQALGCDIPVIMVTGFSDEATAIEALRVGARDFVPKTAEYLQYLPDAVERVLKAARTERELAASEARFQLFMDNSPAAAFVKDEEGHLLYANRFNQQLVGQADWKGKTDFDFWPEETAKELRKHDLAVLRSGKVTEVHEAFPMPDGDVRHFVSFKFPMQDVRGQRFVGGVAVEVTQQRIAEEALRQRDEQFRQAQKMEAIGTLAGGIAHEFNNLLQAVLGYTRFAMASIDASHEAQSDLGVVVSAAERAAVLTQQLLSFSRRETAELIPLDLNAEVHELTVMMRPLIGEAIEIALALDGAIGPVSVDHAQIQQMLMNLCINARDAMPHGGRITISTREFDIDASQSPHPVPRSGRYVALSVSDTGCGMTPEVKEKVFEPFFTTKPVGKGTGLGLAMVYGAVQHHAGAIHVESEVHVGTTFTVYLPISSSNDANPEVIQSAATLRGSETILIAEDEPLVLNLATRMLQNAGYQVLSATDGKEAVRLFQERGKEIDLLILDAVMPQLGGWEAVREIRQFDPSVPVIIATGYDGQHSPVFPAGKAPRVLSKPYHVDQLLSTIHDVLEEATQCPQI